MGGLIPDFMVFRFEDSTALHKQAELGILTSENNADEDNVIFISPVTGFCGKGNHACTTRVLMSTVAPGHIIFIYTIDYMKNGESSLHSWFVVVYLCAAVMQVATLLYVAYIMIHWMWKRKIDPHNSAIPYLTSIGDLLGISLLRSPRSSFCISSLITVPILVID
ncbi:hypothetical protein NQ318_006896 [Aromia moschata]|uniref:SLC41A/MgtE integral membrane domain-containing protein n=1 Tax=Aromia moschata TaxID=1265417 RepID=A0AAV8YKM1_9CUCU|nr:hypothetical protein NQ318_006896 [Aromia moschata]